MANNYSYSQWALDNLEQSQADLEKSLQQSSGSYSSSLNTSPTDVKTEARLRSVQSALDKLQAKQINEKWYGKTAPENTESEGTQKNIIFKWLDALARPLYAVTWAAKYLTWDKSGGFFNTVNKGFAGAFGGIFALLYAISDEYHQSFVVGRSGCVIDVLIDGVGILLGLLWWHLYMRKKELKDVNTWWNY